MRRRLPCILRSVVYSRLSFAKEVVIDGAEDISIRHFYIAVEQSLPLVRIWNIPREGHLTCAW